MSSINKELTHIGLGNMGTAIVHAFLKGDIAVTAWNRTTNRPGVKSTVEAGATLETDVAVAVAKSEIITICVLDYDTIHKILDPAATAGSLGGKTIINLTNGTPKQARELDVFFKQHGVVRYLDAAVMVTPQMVGTEHSFLVASGVTEEIFNELQETLNTVGHALYRGLDIGAAALFDVAALASMASMFQGAFIMLALLKKQRPDASVELIDGKEPKVGQLAKTTLVPFLQALVPYIGLIADAWDERNWTQNFGNPVGMMEVALKNILQACDDEGVDGEGLKPLANLLGRAVREIGEEGGISILGTYLAK